MPVVIQQDPDLIPLCPYCERELSQIVATEPKGIGKGTFGIGKRTAYACPSCRKLLGISHRKGVLAG